jgi:hypothetical protein
MQSPDLRRGSAVFRYRTSAAALAAVLTALAGILSLLARPLAAALLLVGLMLPTLLLVVTARTLAGVLWILVHIDSPVAQPSPATNRIKLTTPKSSNCFRSIYLRLRGTRAHLHHNGLYARSW